MEKNFTHVGVRIISRLKKLGLKQADLCRETGLSTTAISQYCTGKQAPNTTALYKLALALKTSMEWLLTGRDPSIESLTNKDIEHPRSRFEVYCDGEQLNETEADLVAMYRILDDRDREDVFDYVTLKYQKATGEKGSVYSTYTDTNGQQKDEPVSGGKSASGIA